MYHNHGYHDDDLDKFFDDPEDIFKKHKSWVEENMSTLVYAVTGVVALIVLICCCCGYRRHRNRGQVLTASVVPPPPPPGPGVAPYPQQQYVLPPVMSAMPYPAPAQTLPPPTAPHPPFVGGPAPPGWSQQVAGAPLAPPSYEQATLDRDIYEKNPPYNPHHNPSY